LKQIRNFNNSTILAVTSNLDLSNSLKDEFASAKQFTSVDNIIEALKTTGINNSEFSTGMSKS
jgi:hypothetical protein